MQQTQWLDTADRYGADYMSLEAGEMQAKIAKGLVVLQQHLERPELWGVAARMLTVYGKTLPSNDGTKGAVEWYRLASIAADRSGNDQVRVWVRGRAALALAYEGASLRFAEKAADAALQIDDKPSLGRLMPLWRRLTCSGTMDQGQTP